MYYFYNQRILFFTSLDAPSPPQAPLEPTSVTKSSCVLSWRPPKDNGGSPITHYVVEKMDTETLKWVPAGEALDTTIR